MSYKEFCVKTLAHSWHVISKREFVDLKMAIHRFNCINIPQKNVKNINPSLSLKYLLPTQIILAVKRLENSATKRLTSTGSCL